MSYTDLVAALQRDRAEALLREGASVGSVAFAVGFGDATAFGRAYRRWTGKAPSRYARFGTEPNP
jgi:AraC-like DNA-binding protein